MIKIKLNRYNFYRVEKIIVYASNHIGSRYKKKATTRSTRRILSRISVFHWMVVRQLPEEKKDNADILLINAPPLNIKRSPTGIYSLASFWKIMVWKQIYCIDFYLIYSHEARIMNVLYLILGFPSETESDFEKTLDSLRETRRR